MRDDAWLLFENSVAILHLIRFTDVRLHDDLQLSRYAVQPV